MGPIFITTPTGVMEFPVPHFQNEIVSEPNLRSDFWSGQNSGQVFGQDEFAVRFPVTNHKM